MVVATTVTYVTLTTRRKGATENREETHTHSQLTDHRRDGHGIPSNILVAEYKRSNAAVLLKILNHVASDDFL